MHEACEALQRIGHLQELLPLGWRQRQRLGETEADPARVVVRRALGFRERTARFFDQALEDFRTALAKDGLLDNSVIVVYGDHDAGFVRDAALSRRIGIASDDVAWEIADRVPLFVRVPAPPDGGAGRRIDLPAGQTDFAPTLLGLLGVDASRLPYVGRNLLGAPGDSPIVRPFGDWIDRTHLLITRGVNARSCYALPGREPDPGGCTDQDVRARDERDVSRLVVTSNLQQRIRDRLSELVQ